MILQIIYVISQVILFTSQVKEVESQEDRYPEFGEQGVPLSPHEFPWIVMIFSAEDVYTHTDVQQMTEPVCLGILVTSSDVLTTCSCLQVAAERSATSYLLVKPKSSIVWWDDDYKSVSQTHLHPHCQRCSKKSYNDVAVLTIDVVNPIYGLVETLHEEAFHPREEELDLSACFIINLVTGLNTPRLGSLQLEKIAFVVWTETPSPKNDLGFVSIFGVSYHHTFAPYGETRFPGSPLLCRQGSEFVPVGLYLGLYCPKSFTHKDINANCKTTCTDCEDCFPEYMEFVVTPSTCSWKESFGAVLRFDSLAEWVGDNTFQSLRTSRRRKKLPAESSNTSPHFIMVFISIAFLLMVS